MSEIKWQKPTEPNLEPAHGDIAVVWLPIKVLFTHSDKIVSDVDEDGTPLEYRSGLVMQPVYKTFEVPYVDQKVECVLFNTCAKL